MGVEGRRERGRGGGGEGGVGRRKRGERERERSHMTKVYSHMDKLHMAKPCFSTETYKQIITSCNE